MFMVRLPGRYVCRKEWGFAFVLMMTMNPIYCTYLQVYMGDLDKMREEEYPEYIYGISFEILRIFLWGSLW